ncbi:MAG: sodium/solute symporter, partial [Leptospirales bacterium]
MDIQATTLDFAVIVIYFVGILLIGTLFGKFTNSTKDFFFGGQRFAWWLVAMSCVATVVGSYSFVKYSSIGYTHGLSSTMTYLNDWFIVPFFVLGWLPILYFNRIQSIPEYFQRRFDEKTKLVTTFYILVFLVGYVGINLYTLGVALQPLLKINLYVIVVIVAAVGAIYMHAGGQTSVIMTDLLQGFILLGAGFLVLFLGLGYLGGLERFLDGLPLAHKYPFADFNSPPEFNFVGVFWQDAAASSVAFYFMNQGTIMRFLSCRSVRDGRKAMYAIVLVLMPLAVLAIANTGWLGRAMTTHGLIPEVNDRDIFLVVASKITQPGVFGLILAALTAALMSTIDTLINAISAIFVNDIYKPYVKADAPDAHYLKLARIVAIAAAIVGILLVPFFAAYKSIYEVHGTFIASITPPVVT